ncbi:MAG: hypothetical protein LPK45_01975, partial [Bacteroidota bacterium]|nr:hypothetical protein [Bacteroidota bacterium]MDX5429801.1 hypothetical protein [Bacteroidota bacterium]MDX5468580.1 hypothetical protein [Bacteroidota bacterium]
MEDITTPREKILKKVRAGLLNKFATQIPDVELESDIYHYSDEDHAVAFAQSFTSRGGGFVYCHNLFDFHENLLIWMEKKGMKYLTVTDTDLKKELENLGLSLSNSPEEHPGQTALLLSAEALVARNGGIMISSATTRRDLPYRYESVLVLGRMSKMGDDMRQALVTLKNKYGERLPSLIT